MMAKLPDIGMISPDVFPLAVLPQLGARDRRVLVSPLNGVDVGVIATGDGQATAQVTGQ